MLLVISLLGQFAAILHDAHSHMHTFMHAHKYMHVQCTNMHPMHTNTRTHTWMHIFIWVCLCTYCKHVYASSLLVYTQTRMHNMVDNKRRQLAKQQKPNTSKGKGERTRMSEKSANQKTSHKQKIGLTTNYGSLRLTGMGHTCPKCGTKKILDKA